MYPIGLSTTSKVVCEELFEQYSSAGISAMEISVKMEDYPYINYEDLRRWSEKHQVKLWSFHLPFKPFEEIDLAQKELHESSLKYLSELTKRAAEAGMQKIVIHSSGVGIRDDNRAERMKYAKQGLASLADTAAEYGAVIAVENLPPSCLGKNSKEIMELISANDKLRVCFDTNHLLDEKATDFMEKLGDKIVTIHVNDYDFIEERHWLAGEGKIDWQEILRTLKKINYQGVWLYEVAFVPATPNIVRSRALTCEDFVRNAKEIFENRELTVLEKGI